MSLKRVPLLLVVPALFLLAACNTDPKVASKKYVDNGNKYFNRGKYKEASIMYRRALSKDMRSGEAWYRLGLTNLKLNIPQEAIRNFSRARELDPANTDAVVKLTDLELLFYVSNPQGNRALLPDIKEQTQQLLKKDPKSFDGLHDEFVLYAGNVKPHKNLERLIEAFHLVRKRGLDHLKLVLIGDEISKYAALRRAVHRHQLHKYVRFLGYLPEETLAVMYRLAGVFVFPSLYEGFGLPPLEAMASGTPVVTSNVSSLPEVAGDAAVLVDPYDPRAIADGIYRVLTDDALRARSARARGSRARGSFRGSTSVRRVREIYGEVAARVRRAGTKIALVHDWLTGMRGGEKVLEVAVRALSRRRALHARPRARVGVADDRAAADPHVVRPAAAVRAGATTAHYLPLFPTRHRAVRLRSLRSRRQREPLLRQVDRPAGTRAAPLLLPDADALRLGSVRRLLRTRSPRARPAARSCGR